MRTLAETLAHDLGGLHRAPEGIAETVTYGAYGGDTHIGIVGVFIERDNLEKSEEDGAARHRVGVFQMRTDVVGTPQTRDTITRANGEVWIVTSCPIGYGVAHLQVEQVNPVQKTRNRHYIPRT